MEVEAPRGQTSQEAFLLTVALALELVFPDGSPGAGRGEKRRWATTQDQLTIFMKLGPSLASNSETGPPGVLTALLPPRGPTSPVWVWSIAQQQVQAAFSSHSSLYRKYPTGPLSETKL